MIRGVLGQRCVRFLSLHDDACSLSCDECRCDRVGVSHPDLLADPKQKPAILYSEERRLCTRNIRNIYNLFIFPSYFRRWRRSFLCSRRRAQGAGVS